VSRGSTRLRCRGKKSSLGMGRYVEKCTKNFFETCKGKKTATIAPTVNGGDQMASNQPWGGGGRKEQKTEKESKGGGGNNKYRGEQERKTFSSKRGPQLKPGHGKRNSSRLNRGGQKFSQKKKAGT